MKYLFFAEAYLVAMLAFVGCDSNTTTTPSTPSAEKVTVEGETPAAGAEDGLAIQAAQVAVPVVDYVMISPLRSADTFLLNSDHKVVHRWKSDYPPSGTAYLMENGDLLRGARDPDFSKFHGGGIGAIVERRSWEGELLWTFRYADDDHCAHHDIAPLPNGNVLMIAWERKSNEEAVAQGRDPDLLKDELWPGHVIEVQPDGPTSGKIVWQWHMWDHLVQDFDREKANYGVIYEHPELIDLNNTGSTPPATPEELRKLRAVGYTGGGDDKDDSRRGGADWLHTNAINYNSDLDQIALSAKHFSEIWIIDHSTTTEESASHRGGKHDKGGDLLYRWGNPWSYKSGTEGDKMLFDQHDVRWVSPGLPGAGHITAFNNGSGRKYSSIVEIQTPIDEDGEYILDDEGRFGPYELTWEYTADSKEDFYSSFISGASRLPSGNTMICEGSTGRYFEVTSKGEILWEHVNTFGGELDKDGRPNDFEKEAQKIVKEGNKKTFLENNALFRATKYSSEFPGIANRTIAPLAEQPIPFATLVERAVTRLEAEKAEQKATETEDTDQPEADAETEKVGDEETPEDIATETEAETADEESTATEPETADSGN